MATAKFAKVKLFGWLVCASLASAFVFSSRLLTVLAPLQAALISQMKIFWRLSAAFSQERPLVKKCFFPRSSRSLNTQYQSVQRHLNLIIKAKIRRLKQSQVNCQQFIFQLYIFVITYFTPLSCVLCKLDHNC